MRMILALMLIVSLSFAVDPIAKNDNNIQYFWNGLDFEVYSANCGIGGYRETALGADTLFVAFDLSSATYTHGELYIEFTADAANGNYAATKTTRNVAIYWLPEFTYTARTATAGNKLPLSDMNSTTVGTVEYAYRTITPDSTSYANKVMIDNLSGRTGESSGVIGPFWIDAEAATDSTGAGFVIITADTVGVSWQALLIPRT
jgi:hypothetical protein